MNILIIMEDFKKKHIGGSMRATIFPSAIIVTKAYGIVVII